MLNAALLFSVVLAAGAEPAAGDKPQMVVLAFTSLGGAEAEAALALTEAATAEVSARNIFRVLTAQDIQTLTGLERQKQMMGCSDDTSCLAELAGALGARFVLSGSLSRLGSAYQLTMQTLDSHKAQPIGRSTRLASDLESLRALLPYAVAEATAMPLPPPPSRVLSFSLMGVGAAAVLAGGFFGINTLGRERELAQELKLGETQPEVLGDLSRYRAEEGTLGRDKTLSLVAMGVGAALVGLGVFLLPSSASEGGGGGVALVPTGSGAALVGVFP